MHHRLQREISPKLLLSNATHPAQVPVMLMGQQFLRKPEEQIATERARIEALVGDARGSRNYKTAVKLYGGEAHRKPKERSKKQC